MAWQREKDLVMVWVLVLVSALSVDEFDVTPLVQTKTMAECYFESTLLEFELYEKNNQELLCIRVDE